MAHRIDVDGLLRLRSIDVPRAGRVLADAFRHDPIWLTVFRGATRFARRYRAFFETPIRYCLRYGDVYTTSRALEGIAAWLPGRNADMTVVRMLLSGAMLSGARVGVDVMKKMQVLGTILPADRAAHMAGKEYRYLQIIGVATRHQRAGLGSGIVRALSARCDSDGVWLYLETETENNVRFYEKHGFQLLKRIVVPQIDLPMWEMARPPGVWRALPVGGGDPPAVGGCGSPVRDARADGRLQEAGGAGVA